MAALVAVVLIAIPFVAAIGSGAVAGQLGSVIQRPALSVMLTVGAMLGSYTFTADFRHGSLHRQILVFGRGRIFACRAAATFLASTLTGSAVGSLLVPALCMLDRHAASFFSIRAFAGMAALGSAWGFAIGSLVRNHLAAFFVVPLTLALPGFLDGAGFTTRLFFPVLTAEWSVSVAEGNIKSLPLLGSLSWLVLLLGLAGAAFSKRDLR